MCKHVPTAPSEVRNFAAIPNSSTAVSMSWELPLQSNGVIRHFSINITNLNTSIVATHYEAGTTTSTIISFLHPNHRYTFSMAAFTVAMGPPALSQTVLLPQDGEYTLHLCTLWY